MKEASLSSISTDVLIQPLSFILDLLILVDLSIDYSGLYCTALEENACSYMVLRVHSTSNIRLL